MNPLSLLRSFRRSIGGSQPGVHMTWRSRSMPRTMSRTRSLLTTQLWIWPIIAIAVLATIGLATKSLIESTIKHSLREELQTFVELESAMLGHWRGVQQSTAEGLANSLPIRSAVYRLLEHEENAGAAVVDADIRKELERQLAAAMASHHFEGFFVADRKQKILDSSQPILIGQPALAEYRGYINDCLDGKTVVSPPFASLGAAPDERGAMRVGAPTIVVCAPVRDESFQVVAALGILIDPRREFTRIVEKGRIGKTAESYAFNAEGVMVSSSRNEEQLILLGILPDQENASSMLQVSLRDPGGNMLIGYRPRERRAALPLTKMAADAIAGNSGVDVDGYRDYRGATVVGAWKWLPEQQIGLAMEIEAAEAFRPLVILRWTFFSLFGLLSLASLGIFIVSVMTARLRREAQKSAIKAQQLGQYTLEAKLGEGGMGVVYKGHHAMMRRPAAIKMLDIDKMTDDALARFEREVQITCQLNHPNTIAIYDYGRTPEGIFFYAMEYIEGINLQALVQQYGPQPEERVIHILRQICGSLFEAHSMGLVHRDIKPANVMLARRGCKPDVVKVLDFGLVKSISDNADSGSNPSLTGTPLYMSPEAITSPLSVDACSDLYAVGAVGYFLLTGRPVFEADSLTSLCKKHVDEDPAPPSRYSPTPVSEELEYALISCLEKRRTKRPQTARDLIALLNKSPLAYAWTDDRGETWWSRHERATRIHAPASTDASHALQLTIEHPSGG